MTRIASNQERTAPVEVRVLLQPEDHADLCAAAKISGLAATQFARSIIKNYLNKIYTNVEQPTDDR